MKRFVPYIAVACILAAPANATILPAGGECVMKENVSISINFNMKAASLTDAKTKVDEKMAQIKAFAAKQKIDNIEPQSMNYNISQQNYGNNSDREKEYRVSGNLSYKLDSSDVAFTFAEFLEKEDYRVTLNSNSYRRGNCNN